MSDLKGKIIAVTGASSGIGEATARLLAQRGATVFLGARRTDRLETLAREIRDAGGKADFQALDVTSRDSVQDFVRTATERFGKLDALVNNAGLMPLSPLAALKVDEWDRMIDVNIKGVLYGIAAALPVFQKQGAGHVINVASVAGHQIWPTSAVYSGTKYAVRAISEGLRQEHKDVRVTIISPGATESELAETITHKETADWVNEFRKGSLKADAIARAIAYAIEQPADVDVNEIIIRPTSAA